MTTAGSGDDITAEARMLAAEARARAASAPSAAELAELAELAMRARQGSGPEQFEAARQLSRKAFAKANQVAYLLGELAGLLGDGGGGAHEPGQ